MIVLLRTTRFGASQIWHRIPTPLRASVEDAALRLESGPDTFVVFRTADSDAVNILYRRKDGNLGLIEPD